MTNANTKFRRLFETATELHAYDRPDQAHKLIVCRANKFPDDDRRVFCHLYAICPGCNRIRVKKLLSADLPKIESIQDSHDDQVSEYEILVWDLRIEIGELKGEVHKAGYTPGALTEEKQQLRGQIGEIRRNLQGLRSAMDTEPTRQILSEARALVVAKGLPPAKEIVKILSRADQALADALTRYKDYSLQAVTLTRKTFRDHHEDPALYGELARHTMVCFREEFNRGHLSAPGTGAIVGLHLQDNVNVHALYWGPASDRAKLSESWSSITRDGSDQVDCQRLHGPEDVERWLAYINLTPKNTTPESLVRNWKATRPQISVLVGSD
jgi:hypothetical protein